ncbi:ferritin-like domain-containing protein [Candidatus Nitrosacidococcus tergens]|uniref:Ferritin-like domain-containing protein n=1 Tax=Candidatus Nitrosacidococcus tergens TaxID=553981 RepID=A0A7G1Q988_9GAMM|nr:ferritin-like domain-containing protein [Candidatus Nitrosacidococcus tergens]CAB1275269.1 conserved protein of unknown function [Candidatus Nitrosacidococcus tergens]
MEGISLTDTALHCLTICDPERKINATQQVAQLWKEGKLTTSYSFTYNTQLTPGLPQNLRLVAPKYLSRRRLHSLEGRAAFIHAIAHIEFNAINLAWDAIYRFQGLPETFYSHWVQVAAEEAHHFYLLNIHLHSLGYQYGDFSAHNGLWEMAEKTAYDPMVRMALVPRVLEARGLDVTPSMIERLRAIEDLRAIAILEIIFRDEINHVAIGSYWFRYFCKIRNLNPEDTFFSLIKKFLKSSPKGVLNYDARLKAGFSEQELMILAQV